PSYVQLARVFFGGHEAANIGSPVRDAAQPGVDCNRDVRPERLPGAEHIARPEKGRVPLHTRVTVAVQSVWSLRGPIELRTFVIHPVSCESGRSVQWIAFIRPPSIDAEGLKLAMRVPVTTGLFFIVSRKIATILNSSPQVS